MRQSKVRAAASHVFAAIATVLVTIGNASAQAISGQASSPVRAMVLVNDLEAEGQRRAQVTDSGETGGWLLRSSSSLLTAEGAHAPPLRVVLPQFQLRANSEFPYGGGDGALWAGKGNSVRIVGGVQLVAGPLHVLLAPEITATANRDFEIFPFYTVPTAEGRSVFSSPWNTGARSLDLPPRFGAEAVRRTAPGQSAIFLRARGYDVGGGTENNWWGPSLRNALVLSDNAEGFPHLFLRTARPLHSAAGEFEMRWITGSLDDSEFFSDNGPRTYRSLTAFAATWQPAFAGGLTVGAARSVMAAAESHSVAARRWFHFLLPGDSSNDSLAPPRRREQITSLFARWVFPASGLEAWGEWARAELPRTIRDLALVPNATRGYTVGVQWLGPRRPDPRLGIQMEHTTLEQSSAFAEQPIRSFYASRTVPQGYTNRGQVLGAEIGPGSSGQWGALDLLGEHWQLRAFVQRVRWNNDAFFNAPRPPDGGFPHDVTLAHGLRASLLLPVGRVSVEAARVRRWNAFFQADLQCIEGCRLNNFVNRTVAVTLTPGPAR